MLQCSEVQRGTMQNDVQTLDAGGSSGGRRCWRDTEMMEETSVEFGEC